MKPSFQYLHTMIRVLDLEKSIAFYTTHLGLSLIRRKDYPDGRFTLAFLGFSEEGPHVELTHNWDQKEPYQLGTAFGHLAFGVPDIYATCKKMKETGVRVTREPGPMKFGGSVIAFLEDPDGYKIELIEIGSRSA